MCGPDEGEGGGSSDVVVACSALKRSYRKVLASAALGAASAAEAEATAGVAGVVRGVAKQLKLTFLHLDVPKHALETRMASREGHFMSPGLLQSQLDTFEARAYSHSLFSST